MHLHASLHAYPCPYACVLATSISPPLLASPVICRLNGFPCNDIRVAIDVINAAQLGCKKLTLRAMCKAKGHDSKRKGSFGHSPRPPPPKTFLALVPNLSSMLGRTSASETNSRRLSAPERLQQPVPAPPPQRPTSSDWQWWNPDMRAPENESPSASGVSTERSVDSRDVQWLDDPQTA